MRLLDWVPSAERTCHIGGLMSTSKELQPS